MKAVKSRDSEIEKTLGKALWREGLRYRKNYKKLKGKPDFVFVTSKVAVFCDSEFWHGYNWKEKKKEIKSNRKFWINKIERNIDRDRAVSKELKKQGWTVLRFWGQDIKKNLGECVIKVKKKIKR